jgi:hypothetical protein
MDIKLRFDIDYDVIGQTDVLLQELLTDLEKMSETEETPTVTELLFGKEKTLDELYS